MENIVHALKADTSVAEAYEMALVPGLMAQWAERIVANARIEGGMRVLDVACGTGIATRYAAHRCGVTGRAVGVDVDHGMLEIARAVSMKEGLVAEYRYGSACELPFESESFDAALCLQGLQYFPDRQKAMSELHRVLRPESPIVVITWSEIQSCKGWWAMLTALERRNVDAEAVRKPFSLSSASELHTIAEEAGFTGIAVRTEQRLARFPSGAAFVDAMLKGAPSSRHALEQVPLTDWPEFLAEIEDLLAPWQRGSTLQFPTESNVLEARRPASAQPDRREDAAPG